MTFRFFISNNSLKELKKCSNLFQASKQQIEILQSNRRYYSKILNQNVILNRQNSNLLIRNRDLSFNYRLQSSQSSKPKLRPDRKSFSVNQQILSTVSKKN
jgi:hypothetical protein